MIDINKQAVKIDCPECNRLISVTLKQVANEVLMGHIFFMGIRQKVCVI